ncbi:MAG: hypothetical protein JEZ11_08055 [Desulfobacterales bacterium]|nr:hypothetical protein [Desulfobacterales bacterium]
MFLRLYQRHAVSFLTVALFLLAGSQSGGLAWAKKQKHFQDAFLNVSINPENEAPEPFLEMGLFPGQYRIAPVEPSLLQGNAFRDLIPSALHLKDLNGRSPPSDFPT